MEKEREEGGEGGREKISRICQRGEGEGKEGREEEREGKMRGHTRGGIGGRRKQEKNDEQPPAEEAE